MTTLDQVSADAARESTDLQRKNEALKLIDSVTVATGFEPEEQMSLLIMATVLATRRVLRKHGIIDRGLRMRILRTAVAEFDSKLREHVTPK